MVPDGIGYHSRVVGSYGALVALGPMIAFGLMSMLVLAGSQSSVRGVIGFALAVFACPTLPLFGFPLSTGGGRWLAVIASSAVVWAALGHLAARRSTSRAVAGWPEWRREWLRLAIGVWVGAFIGFAIAAVVFTVDF